ncbi:MAG TPA: class II aldolase/adducin family protein [Chloroflexota bacterium]|jgi:L-fuculose-phosphate aldolase|nr:class II aldolase/adducin family protein [Chloroflexota bacterium]
MSADLPQLKRRLIDGLQVLTGEGVLTGSGHLSCRVPDTDTFLINPRYAGVLADPDDICTVSAEGKRIAGEGPIPSESIIHAAVYAHRPDVVSVLHCHPRYAILVGLLEQGLIPFNRESRVFADGVPIYPHSKGINTAEQAEDMVACLGEHWALFLRGHGVVVGGPSIEGTCVSAIQLERACQDQLLLLSFMTPKPLAEAGRGRSNARLENPYRAWPFLLYKNGVRSRAEIKAAVRPLAEGEHY